MKTLLAAAAVAAALVPGSALAQAALSLNHIVHGLPHATCMQRAGNVMRESGLQPLPNTSQAVWGETPDRRVLAAIYCLPTRDVAVFSIAGGSLDQTRPQLENLLRLWRGGN